jgi:hypothetical protein
MNGGDPQCAVDESNSTYALKKIWCKQFGSEQEADAYKGQALRTLTCGEEHMRVWDYTGYGVASFWCEVVREALGGPPPPPGVYSRLPAGSMYQCLAACC